MSAKIVPKTPKGYRRLKVGERTYRTDKIWYLNRGPWTTIGFHSGFNVREGDCPCIRRKPLRACNPTAGAR